MILLLPLSLGVTGVPLVSADFAQYKNSFLFALSLFWEVDVPKMDLSDRASEAAFGLAAVFAQGSVVMYMLSPLACVHYCLVFRGVHPW